MRNKLTIDDLDRAIIAELENDGRLSNTELARRVGLSHQLRQDPIPRPIGVP